MRNYTKIKAEHREALLNFIDEYIAYSLPKGLEEMFSDAQTEAEDPFKAEYWVDFIERQRNILNVRKRLIDTEKNLDIKVNYEEAWALDCLLEYDLFVVIRKDTEVENILWVEALCKIYRDLDSYCMAVSKERREKESAAS